MKQQCQTLSSSSLQLTDLSYFCVKELNLKTCHSSASVVFAGSGVGGDVYAGETFDIASFTITVQTYEH